MAEYRALHWVLKIGNLKKSMYFFEKVLDLKVLRHEEFETGCEATCNGPYAGAWSKTMIGKGPEKEHFALELTYNYGIDGYDFGNDLQYIALAGDVEAIKSKADLAGFPTSMEGSAVMISGPDNQTYRIIPEVAGRSEDFAVVGIRVADLTKAEDYYVNLLGLQKLDVLPGLETDSPCSVVGFANHQVRLQLIQVDDGAPVDHAKSSGRIAFACPTGSVPSIYEKVNGAKETIMTPPLTLPTPGKADVVVTILADRDGYEICFVEDAAFYDLATPTYDVIDFAERATRGGDGAPPPKSDKMEHGEEMKEVEEVEELEEILNNAGDKLVVVDFGAGWCKNCKKIAPSVGKMAAKFADHATFVAVDISEAEDLAIEYEVTSVPRFLYFKNGEKVDDYLGSTVAEIKGKVEALLPDYEEEDPRRSLHWVLKIGNLKESMKFYENVLDLKVLRHEEFDSGCEATCNGPYAGAWSKTMIGKGPEETNFALELTYNYGIDGYEFGNDLQYLCITGDVDAIAAKAQKLGYPCTKSNGAALIEGPDSYKYKVIAPIEGREECWAAVGIRVSDLKKATDYWVDLLELKPRATPPGLETEYPSQLVSFKEDQVMLQLIEVKDGATVDHALSSGRIAFACKAVPPIYEKVNATGNTIMTPPLTLPTPGKADVVVTILADPDGYEICFVEDEAFYDLATPKYDVIDFVERASRGGDGAPPPKVALEHGESLKSVTEVEEVEAEVAAAGGKVVVLDFGAGWCKNCQRIAPDLEVMAKQFSKHAVFLSVDIDDAEDLAMEYEVSNVPALKFLKDGKVVDSYVGSTVSDIKEKVRTLLPADAEDVKRSCHWVFKIGNLKKSMEFYENVLGLRVLRHEEFESGCEATCNGPYAGAWSKTMVGYGPEEENFALELTYNYGIDEYEFGNDYQYIALAEPAALTRAKALGYPIGQKDGSEYIIGPDSYCYRILDYVPQSERFAAVALRVSDLQKSEDYWVGLLGMTKYDVPASLKTNDPSILVGFDDNQVKLQLIACSDGRPVDHAKSAGRIAFACGSVQPIFDKVSAAKQTVLTPPLTLPTPGKADVVVTILADPDGYEICFVEDAAFYDLATPKYDIIDWPERTSRGADGAPPPGKKTKTSK